MSTAEQQRRWRAKKRAQQPTPPKPGRPVTQPCGTVAAHKRHMRKGEPPCEPCRIAMADYQHELYLRRKGKN